MCTSKCVWNKIWSQRNGKSTRFTPREVAKTRYSWYALCEHSELILISVRSAAQFAGSPLVAALNATLTETNVEHHFQAFWQRKSNWACIDANAREDHKQPLYRFVFGHLCIPNRISFWERNRTEKFHRPFALLIQFEYRCRCVSTNSIIFQHLRQWCR